jgi:sec-independent protein translocase protein TatA
MPTLGPWELIIVLVIVVVIFGAGRLSDVGGAVGKSIREFRKATTEEVPPTSAPPVAPPVAVPPAAVPPPVNGPVLPAVVIENKCPSCATVNPSSQVFCGQCGARLTVAAQAHG